MIGQMISHYVPKAHPPLADKIHKKLDEVPNLPASVLNPEGIPLEDASPRVVATFSIPPLFGGSGRIKL